ncbi:hypothetical protein U9M48_007099 [Paspalum notatum var. saurae]|uniref:Uncharacterized protein n=1 Tax=Paspalum notatum var. saurae TaxID=547442 RepID=A0AAQ3SKY4_PASNO
MMRRHSAAALRRADGDGWWKRSQYRGLSPQPEAVGNEQLLPQEVGNKLPVTSVHQASNPNWTLLLKEARLIMESLDISAGGEFLKCVVAEPGSPSHRSGLGQGIGGRKEDERVRHPCICLMRTQQQSPGSSNRTTQKSFSYTVQFKGPKQVISSNPHFFENSGTRLSTFAALRLDANWPWEDELTFASSVILEAPVGGGLSVLAAPQDGNIGGKMFFDELTHMLNSDCALSSVSSSEFLLASTSAGLSDRLNTIHLYFFNVANCFPIHIT